MSDNTDAVTDSRNGCQLPPNNAGVAGLAGLAGSSGQEPLRADQAAEFADLLDTLRAWFRRFIYVVNERDYDTLTLWTVHTWLVEQSRTTPRLLIDSPVPESGKTTLLEHLEKLCLEPVRMSNAGTPAALTRLLQTKVYTLLLDEADRTLNPNKDGIADLYAVLNTGYKKGGTRLVSVPDKTQGWVVEKMSTYAPVAMAGNNPHLPDDTRTRCLTIRLLKDTQGRVQESDWEFIEIDALDLRERIAQQVELVRDVAQTFRPNLPPDCRNRDKERWLPLKQVAALAGSRWAGIADAAIVADLEQVMSERDEQATNVTHTVQLIRDLQTIFGERTEFRGTTDLVEELKSMNPARWQRGERPLTVQGVGSMLSKGYGINTIRVNGVRGYNRRQFEKQWEAVGVTSGDNRPNRQNRQEPLNGADIGLSVTAPEPSSEPVPCRVCGMQLMPSEYKFGTHPSCDPHPKDGQRA